MIRGGKGERRGNGGKEGQGQGEISGTGTGILHKMLQKFFIKIQLDNGLETFTPSEV